MKRGDLVTVAIAGDFGKPRPALIIQADPFELTATVTVLLISSNLVDAPLIRLTVKPDAANGLRLASQIMIDKAMTVRRDRIGQVFGRLDPETMIAVNRSLALFLGLG
ncbi:type II toxin-antitoxin system PemK/MazF family toxin [Bosea sp. F3-2]|uniref:type II toxin-antitoxin system PemK/MazF family toxin n=1 Tax=Bosea sp. F3-2 TaxID=2599640 RepID=UPI0011F0400B|nr:type II toxin-antitoxin system PemK/MazF family toxin [Bosea sp. F3-2]QEL23056.1 type II toxin-antitoxin system PemK/MazF family toxin [Bosea sp. F3-2]